MAATRLPVPTRSPGPIARRATTSGRDPSRIPREPSRPGRPRARPGPGPTVRRTTPAIAASRAPCPWMCLPALEPPRDPAPGQRLRALARQIVEHDVCRALRLREPACALPAVPSHGLECRPADRLDRFVRGTQLLHQPAGGAYGRLDGVADLSGAERTPLQPRDHHLPDGQADGARGHASAEEHRQLRRHHLLEGRHGTGSTRRASPTTSTRTVPPSWSLPATISRATGVSTSR